MSILKFYQEKGGSRAQRQRERRVCTVRDVWQAHSWSALWAEKAGVVGIAIQTTKGHKKHIKNDEKWILKYLNAEFFFLQHFTDTGTTTGFSLPLIYTSQSKSQLPAYSGLFTFQQICRREVTRFLFPVSQLRADTLTSLPLSYCLVCITWAYTLQVRPKPAAATYSLELHTAVLVVSGLFTWRSWHPKIPRKRTVCQ